MPDHFIQKGKLWFRLLVVDAAKSMFIRGAAATGLERFWREWERLENIR